MGKNSLTGIMLSGKLIYGQLRAEPEAMVQFRQLLLVLVIGVLAAYGVNTVIIGPKVQENVKVQKLLVSQNSGKATSDLLMLTSRLSTLQQQVIADQHELAVLTIKEKYIKDHWQSLGDYDQFNRLVFSLIHSSPVEFEENILKTTQLAPHNHDGFVVYPMNLEGRSDFKSFFRYLRFLESRPEIGFLDHVKLSTAEDSEHDDVEFLLSIGRLELKL